MVHVSEITKCLVPDNRYIIRKRGSVQLKVSAVYNYLFSLYNVTIYIEIKTLRHYIQCK